MFRLPGGRLDLLRKIHHLLEAMAFNAVINFGFWSLSDWKWQMKDPQTSCHHSAQYMVEMKSATL